MRFFIILALLAAALIWGGSWGLRQIALIEEGCPTLDASRGQIVVDNRLPTDILLRLHDATTDDFRVVAGQCVAFDVVRLKVSVETWPYGDSSLPNCVANLFPMQRLSLYERGGVVFCDIGRADIDTGG